MQQPADYLTFGQWRYLRSIGQLQPLSATAEPEVLTLEPRLHKLLNFFLEHKDLVVSREQILSGVWGEGAGSDESLSRAVAALRRALQDSRVEPTYIATLSKKGYCWLAPVSEVAMPPVTDQHPEQGLKTMLDLVGTQKAIDDWQSGKRTKLKRIRYIWFSTLILLMFSLSFAFLLNKMNEKAKLPRYLQLSPVSALDGKEQTPLLSADQTLLVFQHQATDSQDWRWVVQQLPSMQMRQDKQSYGGLSQPYWLDSEQILFRAQSEEGCGFWRKSIKHDFAAAVALFDCHQFIAAGQAVSPDGLYWLDTDPVTGQSQLRLWHQHNQTQTLLFEFPAQWRGVSHLLVRDKKAYVLAQRGYSYSSLLELDLVNLDWRILRQFDFPANQLAWWGEHDVLVNKSERQLQVLSLRTENSRAFGELTFNLADSSVWGQSLLASYPADAVTDLRQLHWLELENRIAGLPFVESNRSEYLLQVQQDNYYFVSERSGLPQLWRAQGQVSEQISQFNTQLAIQQLLWFDNKLLVLIDRQLFHFNDGQLQPFLAKIRDSERFVVCHDVLYWTSVTEEGWWLNQWQQGKQTKLLKNVVNLQCGPNASLVLQYQDSPQIKLWQQGQTKRLPVQINWRTIDAMAWTSTEMGLYWLSDQGAQLNYFDWKTEQQQRWPLKQPAQALMSGNGLLFVQQVRAQDTDIVWLHPEPVR